jgi:5-methylcytosine-specific restriction endonuclease McrA
MSRSKRAICRNCGINYLRAEGRKLFCSTQCQITCPIARRCRPECKPEDSFTREVEFKDRTTHIQRVCKICRRSRYINRYEAEKETIEQGLRKLSIHQKKRFGDSFYSSPEWLRVRYLAIIRHGKLCGACGAVGGIMHVDHIKPRSKYPELALDINNLQVLCEPCNLGKSNLDETDWRK